MDKLIKSNFVEVDDVYVIGHKQVKEENAEATESIYRISEIDSDDSEEIYDEKEKEARIKIEKLEQLKIRLQNETEEINRQACELSDEIIARANLDAKKIIDDANFKSNIIFGQKEQEGYNKGYEDSIRKYDELLREAKNIIEEAEEYRKNTFLNQEKEIVNLVLQCVNKILKKKIDESDETVVNLILSSIEDLNSRKKITLKISREDFDSTSKLRARILATFPAIENIEIKIIDNYLKGDIEIESDDGDVNPSIKAQFIKLRDEFSKLLEGE